MRHHQVISLGPVDSFLALDGPHPILRVLDASSTRGNSADRSNPSDASWHVLLPKLLDSSWPVGVFSRDLGTISFESNHASAYSHDGILISSIGVVEVLIGVLLRNLAVVEAILVS